MPGAACCGLRHSESDAYFVKSVAENSNAFVLPSHEDPLHRRPFCDEKPPESLTELGPVVLPFFLKRVVDLVTT